MEFKIAEPKNTIVAEKYDCLLSGGQMGKLVGTKKLNKKTVEY